MGFRTAKIQPITYNANGSFPVKLNQMGNLCEIILNLTGTLTLTTPATNNLRSLINRGDEWAVFRRLELLVNGDVIQSYTGPQLVETARRDYGIHPRLNHKLGDTFSATAPIDSVLPLPIWTPQARKAIETALMTDRVSDIRLNAEWGDHLSVCDNAAGWTVNPQLNLYGFYNTDPYVPPYLKKVARQSAVFTAASTNARIDLPVNGSAIHRLLVNVQDSSGNDDPTKLNNIRLMSGSTVFYDANDTVLREVSRFRSETPRDFADYTIPIYTTMGTADGTLQDVTATPTEAAIENNFAEIMKAIEQVVRVHRSSVSDARAWYDLNLSPDGTLEQCVQTVIGGRALSELYLELDIAGACTVDVFVQAVAPNPFAGDDDGK